MPSNPKKKSSKPRSKAKSAVVSEEPLLQEKTVETSSYAVGETVVHPMFGEGTVTAVDFAKLTIHFEGDRTRQIRDDFVKRRK